MSRFQQNQRENSFQNGSNSFRSQTNNREKKGKYVPPHRNNKNSIKKIETLDLNNTEAFPVFNNNEIVVPTNQLDRDDKKDNISDYLKKCVKTKEDSASKLDSGWMALKRDEKTKQIMYSENDRQYIPMDCYISKRHAIHEKEKEDEYYDKMEEFTIQHEKRLQDDYELYGEDSIIYQEYCRSQRYLEEYPEDDETENENGEDSGEDSGYD